MGVYMGRGGDGALVSLFSVRLHLICVCVFVHQNGYCPFSNIDEVNVSYFIGLRLKAQPSFLISSVSCAVSKWGVKGKGTAGEGKHKLQRDTSGQERIFRIGR